METPYVGEIRIVGFEYAPVGWLKCEGQLLLTAQYPVLYTVLGTTYGGDAITTFALPDLRGRLTVGAGAGSGLSSYKLGQLGGTETVTLTTNQLAIHEHGFAGQVGAASGGVPTPSPVGNYPGPATYSLYATPAGTSLAPDALTGTALPFGGSGAHDNRQPGLVLNYIICVDGQIPPRP